MHQALFQTLGYSYELADNIFACGANILAKGDGWQIADIGRLYRTIESGKCYGKIGTLWG